MAAPNDPPADPPEPGSTTVIVTEPTQDQTLAAQRLEEISTRIDALETQISETIEGQRTWTETTLSPLRQELADLKATLETVTPNLATQFQSLRAELTQQLQELQRDLTAPPPSPEPEPIPSLTPPEAPPNNQPADADAPGNQTPPARRGKRVI